MGLFDAITGNVNTGPIRQAGRITAASYPQAAGTLQQYTGQATGALTDAQKQAIAAQQQAATQAGGDITQGMTQGIGYLQGGAGQAQQDLSKALGLYSPLAQTAGQAFNMYGQALGLGGPQGNAAALNAFRTDPGYTFQMQQGLQALERDRNARGMLSSGNLTEDELRFSQGLADQGYQQWMQNLWGLGGQAPGLAGAQSGLYGQMAGLSTGLGQAEAGLTGAGYGGLANIASQLGSNLSNLYTGTGQEVSGLLSNLGGELGQLQLGQGASKAATLANIFNAQQQAGANALGFWGNLLGGITSGAGRYFGSTSGAQPTATP